LTKDKKIKTINFISWITNPQVWELSNQRDYSIQGWLNENLHDDQSKSVAWYYEVDNLVKFYVRWKTSTYNNICIVYDIRNQSFSIDIWKNFWTETIYINWKYFAWDNVNWNIYEDETWWDDNWNDIEFIRETRDFNFSNPWIRKLIREMILAWSMNLNVLLQIFIYWDYDEELKDVYIDKNTISNSVFWIKTENKLYKFRKVFSKWELYEKWYNFKFKFYAKWKDMQLSLDFAAIRLWVIWNWALNELIEK
jgi:hypothetical protein